MTIEKLRIRQLDKKLDTIRALKNLQIPTTGWIREIRQALGMSGVQLAKRLGVSNVAVHQYEKGEVEGTITLETLRKAASALECDLQYALVPRARLQEIRERQARLAAARIVGRVGHSMRLEDQGVSAEEHARQVEDVVRDLLEGKPRSMWDEF
jgi:predicted DNA-binding mobile mystery protein A